ncbi:MULTISPECIES: ribonuclease G [unclassified Marinobacter]|jgi:ribonuclease G|uniref:ribonuclease G n=2 Tax=Marinobacteraceae TaxID=2887365 RepID=UPI00069E3678|nr:MULTISPECIES: ribonuclease G [unclassified Marinobacter]MCP4065416.1 ribonuclease G [Gammaproteobacteria bacterium]HCA11950.1 ribonuclease G [Marinobacter adhaerens]AKV95147.1 ribonuclease G [Marinobacter sp. CP1]MAK51326.1 ribonuclease G [Marinobacter sp.]MBQ93684.1 ribonuclease G [Marinobacter sp.]|tara:strand:- start:1363 stop:2844 length:1482 start_codon:yes stop_codon:yes gene_type:complete
MSEEILINVTPVETRVALVENGMLQEAYIERTSRKGIVGNIYKGKVVRVLPGMEAAFVDIGLERAAFIHASDVVPSQSNGDEPADIPKTVPDIRSLLREGQSLVVQVTKDPIGTKGARLTTQLSIPSRYLVFMPGVSHVGISQRIEDDTERARLKTLVEEAAAEDPDVQGGYIIRTAAEAASPEDLIGDMAYLHRLSQSIHERIARVQAPAVVYQDLPLFIRTIRDLIRPQTEKVRIDSRESHQRVMEFVEEFVTEFADKVEYYPGERPIFDLYSVEDEIQKALSRKVQLKSGGYVIIDQTEAMTTIDINTGAFVGHRNLEETIFKTNLEAARAISRQLRLRNLGGIIIIDFIDMEDPEHQRQVHRMLEKMLERDHAKTKITGVSELGLVEMTRKRTTESLGQVLCEPCPICDGRGFLKTTETVCYEVFREILRVNRAYDAESYLVMASQSVVDRLLDEESDNVADLETFISKTIRFQVEPFYSQEQYDVVLL